MSATREDLPAFVLVPGSFSLPTFYEKVEKVLRDFGYPVTLVWLPSVGKQFKEKHGRTASAYDDAQLTNEIVAKHCDAGRDVVLVGNSYGGFVIAEAAKGLTRTERRAAGQDGGALVSMVFLSSLLSEVGDTVVGMIGGKNSMPVEKVEVDYIDPLPAEDNAAILCSELPDQEERLRFAAMTDVHSARSFVDPLTYAGWKYMPVTFVVANRDKELPSKYQHESVDAAMGSGSKNIRKVVLESDHSMMVSQPVRVAEIIVEASGVA